MERCTFSGGTGKMLANGFERSALQVEAIADHLLYSRALPYERGPAQPCAWGTTSTRCGRGTWFRTSEASNSAFPDGPD